MSTSNVPLVLSPTELHVLPASDVSILDATWFMPNSPRNARDEFLSKRIPDSQYLDLDYVASPHELGLKHMMPSARTFADACRTLSRVDINLGRK
jgi:thiosulfate/3-mercaptopyruvate sulfurtransferase